jgi:hypothetical protein
VTDSIGVLVIIDALAEGKHHLDPDAQSLPA